MRPRQLRSWRLTRFEAAPTAVSTTASSTVDPTAVSTTTVAATRWRPHAHWEAYHTFPFKGSEIKWLCSETFLFWRAAGEENFALEPPNKPFSFDFQVGPTLCETLEKCR